LAADHPLRHSRISPGKSRMNRDDVDAGGAIGYG
jgi:hypothetical protein